MKTKELIKLLQESDPSGELECVMDGDPIHFVSHEPAYCDGDLSILVGDEDTYPTTIRITNKGDKLKLHSFTWRDFLLDNPEAPIDLSDLDPIRKAAWENRIEAKRKEYRALALEIDDDIEEGNNTKL